VYAHATPVNIRIGRKLSKINTLAYLSIPFVTKWANKLEHWCQACLSSLVYALLANIRLGQNGLSRTNTVAYFAFSSQVQWTNNLEGSILKSFLNDSIIWG
jgi:hypothetical protein